MRIGMTKLITSYSFDPTAEVGMRLIEDPSKLVKTAGTLFGCEYDDIKPDEKHAGIHLVALGAYEAYGANRNLDAFDKHACIKYHDTFVKNGAVFRNHCNKDRAGALGDIVKSAYNPDMHRIELFVHVDKDKARPELQKLATDGEHAFSMGTRVPNDRCDLCGTLRKHASDPNQCDHVRNHLGELRDDGSLIFVHNDQPTFFDISFVKRPADRIAWDLKQANVHPTHQPTINSIKLATEANLWVPDHLILDNTNSRAKRTLLQKLADFEQYYQHLSTKSAHTNIRDRYFNTLRDAATTDLGDEITALRAHTPKVAFAALARQAIVLPADAFFKYAFGQDYGELAPSRDNILRAVAGGLYTRLLKSGAYQDACSNDFFDVDYKAASDFLLTPVVSDGLRKQASLLPASVEERVLINAGAHTVSATPLALLEKTAADADPVAVRAAELYAAYTLSAATAALSLNKLASDDEETALGLLAIQHMLD